MIEPPQAVGAQQVGEAIAARLELGIGHDLAALGHDEGRLLRPLGGMLGRIHGNPP